MGTGLIATYRIQLQPGVGFAGARALLPLLERLGIGTVYLSPVARARPGSTHGYDVIDPTTVSEELGGRRALEELRDEAHRLGMHILVDIVPNHMATGEENEWLQEVYRNGRRSRFARFFDVDWGRGPITVPVLGASPDDAVADVKVDDGHLTYFEHRLPLRPGTNMSFDVGAILDQQHYRLTHWREPVTYRRFFDINELICLRQEDLQVFELTHATTVAIKPDALRIDHIDGLWDPQGYLERLSRATGGAPLYVEKILSGGERLPRAWPVAGTTGYEFARALGHVTVDRGGWARLVRIAAERTGDQRSFDEIVRASKVDVLRGLFRGEVEALARRLHRRNTDIAIAELAEAIVSVAASFPVYRTYVREDGVVSRSDRSVIDRALRDAARHGTVGPAARAIGRALRHPGDDIGWMMRFQQLTGPATAKGFEDTAMYRHVALLSRNEVGGEPGEPPGGPDAWHAFCSERRRTMPDTLNATSTHDTKRGEDVRARLDVLSEIPEAWERFLRTVEKTAPQVPDALDRMFVYQTLLGAWPLTPKRLDAYLVKAAREAKRHTNWHDPDERYERVLCAWARGLLRDETFLRAFAPLQRRVARHGAINALSAVVLKVAAPGIPDFYQGTESWWLRLVDPDNRGPVDARALRATLDAVDEADPRALLRAWEDGRVKAYVTQRALRFRRENAALFARGAYVPLRARGPRADNLLAFARRRGKQWAIAIVPRFTTQLGNGMVAPRAWDGTTLELPEGAPRAWTDVLLNAPADPCTPATTLRRLPVSLLSGR